MQRRIFPYDITTAFMHATLDPDADPIYVWPPEEYYPLKNIYCGDSSEPCAVFVLPHGTGNTSSRMNFRNWDL